MLMSLTGCCVEPFLFMLRIMKSRSDAMLFLSIGSMFAFCRKYAIVLGLSPSAMGCLSRTVCHPLRATEMYELFTLCHQGSWMRRMSMAGFLCLEMLCITACVAAFEQLMFRLHTISVAGIVVCRFIESALEVDSTIQSPSGCQLILVLCGRFLWVGLGLYP